MSNVMNMKHLENKVTKNGFDLSNRNCFTAKVGEILPIYTRMLYPNQKVKVKTSSFTRTIPLNTAAYTRVREYYDFFFVPMRLLWRYSDQFFTQMRDSYGAISPTQNGNEVPQLPYFGRRNLLEKLTTLYQARNSATNGKDIFNRPRYATIQKLLEYLDYGIFDAAKESTNTGASATIIKNFAVTPFRLLAYQKIYYDYFRMSQWEKNMPQFYNIDYINPQSPLLTSLLDTLNTEKHTIFDLHYCNYNKDLFTGVLPTSQYGDESNVSIIGSEIPNEYRMSFPNGDVINSDIDQGSVGSINGTLFGQQTGTNKNQYLELLLLKGHIGKMSILALRQAEALQKWKEIAFSGNEDYRTQIKKHFGIDPGPVRSAICEHLGGFQSNIQISEVVNQNLTGENSADIQGKGISSSDGFIEYECKEHGFFMCVYHAKPILDYAAVGLAPDVTKTYPQDFVIPEFDRIGMQTIPNQWLTADQFENKQSSDASEINQLTDLGYTPRYAEFKTDVDKVHGAFNSSYNTWVAPWNAEYINNIVNWNDALPFGSALDYTFFKVPPFALDSILSITHDAYDNSDSDHFLCCVDFNIDSLQPIDRDGLPY